MDVKTLIQPTARAIRVVELEKGTVYKRIVKEYNDSYKVMYGIVLDILNNGTEAYIDVLEVDKSYGGYKFEFRVLGSTKDLNLFPTTKAEVSEFFHETRESVLHEIEETREKLAKQKESLKRFDELAKDNFAQIKNTQFIELDDANLITAKNTEEEDEINF